MLQSAASKMFRSAIRQVIERRATSNRDCCLILQERCMTDSIDRTIYQQVAGLTACGPRAGNDCLVRFVQVASCEHYLMADLPSTVLSTAEAQRLHSREFVTESGPFAPTQKFYLYSQSESLANDLAFIFFNVWGLPPDSTISATFELLLRHSIQNEGPNENGVRTSSS